MTPSMAPGTTVRLFIDGDPATPESGLTIEYRQAAAYLQRKQLDPSIVSMVVEFLDRRTNRWFPYSQAATIRPIAARVWFPPPENPADAPPVPSLLQIPMLFVMAQQQDVTQPTQGSR
jgi:hypothetical protein